MTLFDENFNQLAQKPKMDIDSAVWWINVAQPGYLPTQKDSYLLACEMKGSKFKPKYKKKRPNNIYKGKSMTSDTWLVKCTWDDEEQMIKIDEDMAESMLITDWKVESACEYAENKLLVQLQWTDLLVINNWVLEHRVTLPAHFTIE